MVGFGTDGVRLRAEAFRGETLDRLAYAAYRMGCKEVLIGRDTRPSGERIAGELAERLSRAGLTVGLSGVLTTPALSYLCAHTPDCLGLMVSASHNPPEDNGVKFINGAGEKPSAEQESLLSAALASAPELPARQGGGIYQAGQRSEEYLEALVKRFGNRFLKGKRVKADGAEGGGSELAPKLLRALGAEVVPLHCDGIGENINRRCGALCPELLVGSLEEGEIGFALDGDGDRCIGAYGGGIYDGDDLLFLFAQRMKEEGQLSSSVVVGTEMTNTGLEIALTERGIGLERVNVGDKYIVRRMKEKGYALGGESSGHIIEGKGLLTGDGLLSGVLFAALDSFPRYPAYAQAHRSVEADEEQKSFAVAHIPRIRKSGEGRIVVRPSGTERKIRITAEFRTSQEAEFEAERAARQVHDLLERRENA